MVNQVTLVGRLTRDPSLRYTPEGTAVCHFVLAVNRPYKNNKGEHDADFVQCVFWRKLAESTATYCKKGRLVAVVGRIQSRSYENGEGRKVYVTEVIGERIRFLDKLETEQPMAEEISLDQLIGAE